MSLSPRQMFLLDEACKPIRKLFREGNSGVYLVGSAMNKGGSGRDVDVRLMLDDAVYDRIAKALPDGGIPFLSLVIAEYLAGRTDLPIDFQIQQTSAANALHGKPRNPLGGRHLFEYAGDAPPQGKAEDDSSNGDSRHE